MTLPLSGPMSANMINVELGRAGTAPFDINGTPERTLAQVPTGIIKFSDFYGKSNAPPVNPLYGFTNGTNIYSFTVNQSGNSAVMRTTALLTGKVYVEFSPTVRGVTLPIGFGIDTGATAVFYTSGFWGMFSGNGGCGLPAAGLGINGSEGGDPAYSFVQGDRIGIAIDVVAGKMWFSKNGAWISGDPAAGTSPSITFTPGSNYRWHTSWYSCNISSGNYTWNIYPRAVDQLYPAPAGFLPYNHG